MHDIWKAAAAVVCLNLPFGFWRAGERRFSLRWFAAVHIPVPLVVGVRLISGLGWHLMTFPVLAGAFLTGQIVGGTLRHRWKGATRHSRPGIGSGS